VAFHMGGKRIYYQQRRRLYLSRQCCKQFIEGRLMMKRSLLLKLAVLLFFASPIGVLFAKPPQLPPNYPPGLYDEEKVPQFTLPDPLVTLDGVRVTDVDTWNRKRRPEIIKLFENNVYGRTMIGKPAEMTWKVTSAVDSNAITKNVTIYFTGKTDGPKMDLNIFLPLGAAKKPTPVFLIPGWYANPKILLPRGYGLVTFNPGQIEPDNKNGYAKSIRKAFAKPEQTQPEPDEWGAIGAWAWAASRAMDYIVTDHDIDANKVAVLGFSRFGKVAMWAGAQDQRFAIVFSGGSGCGGATIVRRGFGETVRSINGFAPYWFCRNFKTYGNRVNDLPVDWHMLIALMAPRPVYIAVAEQDYWGDPRGSFLAAKYAEPVYKLFGKQGLDVDEMPPIDTPVSDTIGFHNRKGGHALTDYDWQQFFAFTDRHFAIKK
jgi:hypothetical protein